MTVTLSEAGEAFVRNAMRSGQYASADEVVDVALSLLEMDRMSNLSPEQLREMSLVDLFAPIRAFNLDFSRDETTGRDPDL